ncbi:MAG: winged helix-turn-helix domain-containing protein [Gaiellaceae bacterium]
MSTALLLAGPEPYLERHLRDDGFQVVDEAAARPDLVLLADSAALEECRARHGDVPVIVLGEPESDAVDRARALERGCDDFLVRPFAYEELLARIRAVLRRTSPPPHEVRRAGAIVADLATRSVTVDGGPVALAGKEYELLLKLMTDATRVFTKEQLLRDVWGFRSLGRTRTLDSHASRLRRKLAAAGAADVVINVWGVGYRLL